MLFSGPYDPGRERVVVLVAQRLMFARIAADVLDRLSDLSGIPGRADEAMGLEVNLRLSRVAGLSSALAPRTGSVATCTPRGAITGWAAGGGYDRAACGADSVK